MNADKKVRAGKRRFIVPTRIGDATIIDDTTDEEVRAVLRTLCDAPEACE
jgi:3-dehydroquinate synthetase